MLLMETARAITLVETNFSCCNSDKKIDEYKNLFKYKFFLGDDCFFSLFLVD